MSRLDVVGRDKSDTGRFQSMSLYKKCGNEKATFERLYNRTVII